MPAEVRSTRVRFCVRAALRAGPSHDRRAAGRAQQQHVVAHASGRGDRSVVAMARAWQDQGVVAQPNFALGVRRDGHCRIGGRHRSRPSRLYRRDEPVAPARRALQDPAGAALHRWAAGHAVERRCAPAGIAVAADSGADPRARRRHHAGRGADGTGDDDGFARSPIVRWVRSVRSGAFSAVRVRSVRQVR